MPSKPEKPPPPKSSPNDTRRIFNRLDKVEQELQTIQTFLEELREIKFSLEDEFKSQLKKQQ